MLHSTRAGLHDGLPAKSTWKYGRALTTARKTRIRVAYDEKIEVLAAPVQPNVLPIPAHLAAQATPQVPRTPAPAQEDGEAAAPRLSWWQRPCPGYVDIHNMDDLQAAINSASASGQHVVIELYAGWCAACKASFGNLCKLPQDPQLKRNVRFYKVNVETDEGLFWWMKRAEIRTLPHMVVWGPQGDQLINMSSSFKKMPQVKASLQNIVAHPTAKKFVQDAAGIAQPCGQSNPTSSDTQPTDSVSLDNTEARSA